jgi:glycosyltransferase involved in cell wall biosynthesis
MTTYNGSKYIVEQLDSLKDQTLPADEVQIFDDGSTDDTPYIVQKYIKENGLENWTFKVNEKNLGFKENFYQAIKSTTGDIVFLCDQDDVWHHDKIETMIQVFENNADIKILNTSFQKIDGTGSHLPIKRRLFKTNNGLIRGLIKKNGLKKFSTKYIIRSNITPGCTSAFKKELKEYYLENASQMCPHDWELNLFASFFDGLYYYNRVLTDYRIHSSNAIGLAEKAVNFQLRMSKSQEKRMNFIEDEYQRMKYYLNDGFLSRLKKEDSQAIARYGWFVEKRLAALKQKKLKYWLCSLLYPVDYLRMVGLRGLIGDFILIVTH